MKDTAEAPEAGEEEVKKRKKKNRRKKNRKRKCICPCHAVATKAEDSHDRYCEKCGIVKDGCTAVLAQTDQKELTATTAADA